MILRGWMQKMVMVHLLDFMIDVQVIAVKVHGMFIESKFINTII